MTDLGVLPEGLSSAASSINDAGVIVGYCAFPEDDRWFEANAHAFVYKDGVMTDLGTLGGTLSRAQAINNKGDIVGLSVYQEQKTISPRSLYAAPWTTFIYDGNGMRRLGTFPLQGSAGATGINDAGVVVGYYTTRPGGESHAFRLDASGLTDLGSFGFGGAGAHAVNASGWIVGSVRVQNRTSRPFLYRNGVMQNLGGFGGSGTQAQANAINASGQVVGCSCLGRSAWANPRAFLWEAGTLRNLNDRIVNPDGWLLVDATGINDAGLIVANGQRANGQGGYVRRAFLLTPQVVESPVVVVTGRKRLVTSGARYRFTGTTAGEVTNVVFYRNGQKTARPVRRAATAWQFTPTLRPGRNVFVVEARGYAGRTSAKIVIHRR